MTFLWIWAGRLPCTSAKELGAVRLMPGWEGTMFGNDFWVRGPSLEAHHERALARIPWESRFDVIEGNILRRRGELLPAGRLPETVWSPLREWLQPHLPVSTGTVLLPRPVKIELRAGTEMREPRLVEAKTADWLAYARQAPEIRLKPLAFALDTLHPDTVLIRGTPLPPIPGTQFAEEDAVATQAGFGVWPRVGAGVIRAALGVEDGELIVLRTNAGWSRVPRTAWIGATRGAVRAMAGETI